MRSPGHGWRQAGLTPTLVGLDLGFDPGSKTGSSVIARVKSRPSSGAAKTYER